MTAIPLKSDNEISAMREASRCAATVLDRMCKLAEPGMTTYDLDQAGKEMMAELGCESACLNYPGSHGNPYPGYTCLSVNDEIVHGIGNMKTILKEGDNIAIDVVVNFEGFLGDNARTIILEPASTEMEFLVKTTEEALYHGIDFARVGNKVGDISHAIQKFVESRRLSVVREFVGHGIGRSMHEAPQIPNFGKKNRGDLLKAGMTLAIEPMVNMGKPDIRMGDDGWTALTRDGKPAAHLEHTVLITNDGPEILTIPDAS